MVDPGVAVLKCSEHVVKSKVCEAFRWYPSNCVGFWGFALRSFGVIWKCSFDAEFDRAKKPEQLHKNPDGRDSAAGTSLHQTPVWKVMKESWILKIVGFWDFSTCPAILEESGFGLGWQPNTWILILIPKRIQHSCFSERHLDEEHLLTSHLQGRIRWFFSCREKKRSVVQGRLHKVDEEAAFYANHILMPVVCSLTNLQNPGSKSGGAVLKC